MIGHELRVKAAQYGAKEFVTTGSDTHTYASLNDVSDRLAAGLQCLGLRAGDRIGTILGNRREMVELFFACAKSGLVQVPFNVYLKGDFLRHQITDAELSAVVVDNPGYAILRDIYAEAIPVANVVLVDDAAANGATVGAIDYRALTTSEPSGEPLPVSADDLFSLIYTSGTTGRPKACQMTHGYYLRVAGIGEQVLGLGPEEVLITAWPLFHSAARMVALMGSLVAGGHLVLEPEFSASNFMRRVHETLATVAAGVGAMGIAILKQPEDEWDRGHRLRLGMWTPMTVPDQLEWERRFGGMARCSIYGQTECVEMVWAASDNLDLPRASAGKVAGDITLDIVDDDGKPLPTGEVGEMVAVAQTPHAMFSGYWSGPGQGKVDVSVGRVHHTGDRGRFDADGWFHYAERKSESIRRRGENVSSVQVEAVLEQYAAIAEAAVHDVPSSLSESEIKACVVLEEDATLDVEDFWEYCKSRIPYFAIPRYVEVLPSLPKNALLRVVKPTLRERGITEETLDLIALGYVFERGERRRSGDAK